MMLRTLLLAVCPLTLLAQSSAPAAFEVASIKPTTHPRDASGWSRSSINIPDPGRLVAENSSLSELIRFAYDLKDYQLAGPPWLNDDTECFDIVAKASSNATPDQMRAMLQTLLAERFHLAVHHETRTLPVYKLKRGKHEPLLHASAGGAEGTNSDGRTMTATHTSMADFAHQLARDLGVPVFDETGIQGDFDFTLKYDKEGAGGRPTLPVAVEEQLGLRLESAKGPVDFIVVDRIDKSPTAN